MGCLNNASNLDEIMNIQHLIIASEEQKGEKLLEIYNDVYKNMKRN